MIFELKLSELVQEIRRLKKKPKLILVQVPEGLKEQVKEIASFLEEKTKASVVASAEPCFGACDLALKDAEVIGADLIVHFGHNSFGFEKLVGKIKRARVLYWPLEIKFDAVKVAEKILEECKSKGWNLIGIASTVQYLNGVSKVQKILEEKRIQVFSGQVLGCNYSSLKESKGKVQGLLFVGDGLFHALGLQFQTAKKVLALNPNSLTVKKLETEKDAYYRQRLTAIGIAKNSKSFGILVSTKPGQFKMQEALKAKELIESEIVESGEKRNAVLLAAGNLKPEHFVGVKVDCFVNTACPRISIEDSALFGKPVLSFKELEIALGTRKLEEFK